MNITLVATKTCQHRPLIERELQTLNVPYTLAFIEDHPDWVQQLGIRHSPEIVIDGEVVFRRQPTLDEIRALARGERPA